ncbi:hypothetical protein [Streptomyces sp. NPDC006879]|uniref:hypothetical protein n=1 Tax=Streptomyces sp. NPDC006879 TaxID=3364767 RepID=UPI0036ACC216
MARRNGCLIGCAVALVLGVGLVALLFVGVGKVMEVADKTLVAPSTYEAVRTGDPESEVRAKLPSGKTVLTSALKKGAPVQPAGSDCSWYLADTDADTVYRFCFKDDKLSEKVSYPMAE